MSNEEKIVGMLEIIQTQMNNMENRMETMQKQLDAVQETTTRVAITQENVVLPRIQLLLEGHSGLAETRAKNDRVAALEEEMAIIKPITEKLSIEVAKLKSVK